MTTNRMEDKHILNDKIGSHSVKTVIEVLFFIFFCKIILFFSNLIFKKNFQRILKLLFPELPHIHILLYQQHWRWGNMSKRTHWVIKTIPKSIENESLNLMRCI